MKHDIIDKLMFLTLVLAMIAIVYDALHKLGVI